MPVLWSGSGHVITLGIGDEHLASLKLPQADDGTQSIVVIVGVRLRCEFMFHWMETDTGKASRTEAAWVLRPRSSQYLWHQVALDHWPLPLVLPLPFPPLPSVMPLSFP